ncbi:MAG: hypothetical protein ABIJ46_02595, partial [bacterium]
MKGDRKRGTFRRLAAACLLFVFGVGLALPALFANARPALAFPTEDIVTETQTTVVNVFNTIKDNLVEGAVSALVNGANYFLSKMAYELAVSLTSDCPGQTVCWDSTNLKSGLENAWKGAVGEAVGTLSEVGGFSEIGFNLCDPSNPLTALRIQVGVLDSAGGAAATEPRCSFQSIRDNWSSLQDELTSDEALDAFMPQFSPGQSGLGVALGIFGRTEQLESDALAEATLKRITQAAAGGGFSDVVDPVSGRILSPSSVVKSGFERMEKEKEEAPRESQERTSAGQIAKGAVLSVVVNTVQTFVQTFVSRLWNKFTSGLLSAEEAITAQPDIILSEEGLFRPPGRRTSREVLTRLLTPPSREVGAVDPLLNFTVCPPTNRLPDNCVMDSQFANAVRIAGATPLTVAQAIEEGYLHGEWPLVSAGDPRNQDPFCYTNGYCEGNLKKLRAARVLPIGWEIAASQAYGPYANFTLQDAISSFHDCNEVGERDSRHPFCNLLNPEWVLKVPPAQCRAQSYGAGLVSPEIPQRMEECVDYRTCLKQDDYGNCVGGWGYCVRERNAWRFNGDQCPAQFSTCRMLNPSDGGSPVSYLMNTVDFGVCNADNVGCQDYATDLNTVSCQTVAPCEGEGGRGCQVGCTVLDGAKTCSGGGISCRSYSACDSADGCEIGCEVTNGQNSCASSVGLPADKSDDWMSRPVRYFNGRVESCDARDVGCTTLIKLSPRESLNTLKNSSFESQDDTNRDGRSDRPIGWVLPAGQVPDGRTGSVASDLDGVPDGRNMILLQKGGGGADGVLGVVACNDPGGCVREDGGYSCVVPQGQVECIYGDRVVHGLVALRPGQLHTVSGVFVSAADNKPASGRIIVSFFDQSGARVAPGRVSAISSFSSYMSAYDSTVGVGGTDPCNAVGDTVVLDFVGIPNTLTQVRAACSFYVSNPNVAQASIEYAASRLPNGSNAYLDAAQFEQGALTRYHGGYSVQQTQTVKLAPAYLECTGEPNDRPECASFARVCRENEVGCESYTPTNGDPSVPGIISDQDYCPAECVGYDMFFQEETDFESRPAQADNFIPSTARQCSATEVGCTSFTNLENEAVEYFSRLRICSAPDDRDVETFYTWEGSDTTGFQLRSWALKRTEDAAPEGVSPVGEPTPLLQKMTDLCLDGRCGEAPCVRLDPGNPNLCVDAPADPADRDGFCSQESIDRGDYDCREFYDSDGSRHFRRLSSTIVATADCSRYRLSGRSQEDCEKWNGDYDAPRGECIYRASASWSRTCSAAAAGCRSYRGNAATNVRTVFVDDFESEISSRWGGFGGRGLEQSSESVIVGGHSLHLQGGSAVRRASGPSVSSGNLFSVSFWARGNGSVTASVVQAASGTCPTLVDQDTPSCDAAGGCLCRDDYGHSCTILNDEVSCLVDPVETAELAVSDPVAVTTDWRRYEIGPVALGVFSTVPGSSETLRLAVGGAGEVDVYLDNVVFTHVRDNINVIRGSWNTPDSCNRTSVGAYSPLEMLGCRQYTTSQRATVNLRSISNLCRDVSVGCSAYSDTKNTTDTVGPQTYGAVCRLPVACGTSPNCSCDYEATNPADAAHPLIVNDACRVAVGETECRFTFDGLDASGDPADYPDRFVVPADERIHLVVTSKDSCAVTSVGCRNLGLPTVDYERQCTLRDPAGAEIECADPDGCECVDPTFGDSCIVGNGRKSCYVALDEGTVSSWKGVAVKDDPSKYDRTLCQADAVGCQSYKAADGAYYMKSPGNQVCEFKTNVQYNGRVTSGWFRKSPSGSIFPCYDDLLVEGATYGIYRNRDASYSGWVGACPAEYDRCEEFLDPNDTTETGASKAYYYLDNTKLDRAACGGQASLSRGCVLLNQTSLAKTSYSTAATYFRSQREAGGGPVSPVSCSPGSTDQNCQNRCYRLAGYCTGSGDPCSEDDQCGVGQSCNGVDHWGNSCLVDKDCDLGLGENCRNVVGTPEFGNDTNTVMKVRQDRECAEWLECDQYSLPVYDSVKGRWTARCAGVSTCQSNMRVGDSFVCTDFKDTPKKVLTAGDYAARDTSWRGLEYSGYSIIDRYPPQFLRAYKITTGQCLESGEGEDQPVRRPNGSIVRCRTASQCRAVCDSDEADCVAADVHCSAPLAGVCLGGDFSNQSCNSDADCSTPGESGRCSLSEFDTTRFGIRLNLCRAGDRIGQSCYSDENCFINPAAVQAGACAVSCTQDEVTPDGRDGCPSDGHDPSCIGAGCPAPHGTCVERGCVYDYRGGPLRSDDWDNAPSCRAYPEADSPFPQDVLNTEGDQVKSLREAGATAGYDASGNPVQKQAQYRGANVCYEGNSCECSYARVAYGSGNSKVRFQSPDRSIKYRATPERGQVGDFVAGSPAPGVCLSGPFDGRSCTPGVEGQCGPINEGGSCVAISSYTLALGWPGFCVDQNESRSLYGSEDKLGCNLWLPLDMVPGLSDSYSYSPEAGFQSPVPNLTYCAEARGYGEGDYSRGVCSNDMLTRCFDDEMCEGGVCLNYAKLVHKEEAYGSPLSHEYDQASADDQDHWFHFDEGEGARERRDSCPAGRRNDCNTHYQTTDPIAWPLERLAGIGVKFNRGMITMSEDNGWGFALHWNGADDHMRESNLEIFSVGGTPYIKNQASDSGLDCLDWLKQGRPNDSPCHNGYSQGKQNCIAAWAHDDGAGQVSIETVICGSDPVDIKHWVPVDGAWFYLREECTVLDVVSDQTAYPSNVAWTDRLYDLNGGRPVTVDNLGEAMAGTLLGLESHYWVGPSLRGLDEAGLDHAPLGAIAPQFSPETDRFERPIPVVGALGTESAGSPYTFVSQDDENQTVDFQASDPLFGRDIAAGLPMSCLQNCNVPESLEDTTPVGGFGEGVRRLGNLFAKMFDYLTWNEETSGYVHPLALGGLIDVYRDYRVQVIAQHQAPQVFPADTGSESCTNDGRTCPEISTAPGLSVDGHQRDVCYDGGFATNVELAYYAFADSNHMPIRRHIIDYGDGSDPLRLDGSFKNRRGLDDASRQICGSDATDWGLSADACDSSYMSFKKTYVCTEA